MKIRFKSPEDKAEFIGYHRTNKLIVARIGDDWHDCKEDPDPMPSDRADIAIMLIDENGYIIQFDTDDAIIFEEEKKHFIITE